MRFGKRKLNMAARRGTLQAIADANIKVPRQYAVLLPSGQNKLWLEVMGTHWKDEEGKADRAYQYNKLVSTYETAYDERRDLIENCEHDFGDRSRHWGIDDSADCNHCGVAVSSGGLLDIPNN